MARSKRSSVKEKPAQPLSPPLIYPRLWKHKKTNQSMRVMPWWEIPEPVLDLQDVPEVSGQAVTAKFGVLVQVGYLMENEHGVWFGFGPSVRKSFEDCGEWKKENKK